MATEPTIDQKTKARSFLLKGIDDLQKENNRIDMAFGDRMTTALRYEHDERTASIEAFKAVAESLAV